MNIDFTDLLILFSQALDLFFPEDGLQGVSRAYIVMALLSKKNAPRERQQGAFVASLLYNIKLKMGLDIKPIIIRVLRIYNSSIAKHYSLGNDINIINMADKFCQYSKDEIVSGNYPSSSLKYLCNSMGNEFSIDDMLYLREIDQIPGVWSNLGTNNMVEDVRLLTPFSELRLKYNKLTEFSCVMADIIDNYCQLPFSYSKKISEHCAALAKLYGFPLDGIETMRTAGLLHGIGKLSLPTKTLLKVNKLTSLELEQYKAYPLITRRILSSIKDFFYVARIASHIHEKLNGSGFPENFKGTEISLSARIISVSRAYVHLQMVSGKGEMCNKIVFEKLREKSMKGFLDANVVAALEHALPSTNKI